MSKRTKTKYFAVLTLAIALPLGINQTVSPTLSSNPRSVRTIDRNGKPIEIASRSLDVQTTPPLAFGPSVFQGVNFFFLGANSTNQKSFALSRAFINTVCQPDGITLTTLDFLALAPQKAFVNKKQNACKVEDKTENPLYNADIAHLSLTGPYLTVVPITRNPNYTDPNTDGENQNIVLVLDTTIGEHVLTNTKKINDAAGNPTGGISGIASTAGQIFAAVNHTGESAFGGDDSGIAIVIPALTDLEPIDATTGQEGNKAVSVKNAAVFDAADAANITLTDNVTLYWDPILTRLFVGLQGTITIAGGTFFSGILIGRFEGGKLILEPIVPASVIGTDESTDKIVALYKDTPVPSAEIAIHLIKTMYTSTSKGYLIVNGNTDSTDSKKEVFAMPFLHQQFSDGDFSATSKELIGKLATNDPTFGPADPPPSEQPAEVLADLATKTDDKAKVGQGLAPADIENMFVLGDAVYVACAGGTRDTQGIFQSSAIFDENGLISGWTPWQRVMGATDPVTNGAIDLETGQFWYLAQTTSPGDTIKVTFWSQNDTRLLGHLHNKLVTTFPQDTGGVHQLFNFDEKTASFQEDEFSMMVATGYQKVALIQTGTDDAGIFVPTSGTDFSTDVDDTVKVFSDPALTTIGPLCCAAVSRSSDPDEGWLFVGGHGGVAVLSDGSGDGWTQLDSLTDDITTPGFTFKTVDDFACVHKLVCDDEYLYVLTPEALHRVTMTTLASTIIAEPATLTNGTPCDALLDFIVAGNVGILATTSGLYRTPNSETIKTSTTWTEVRTKSNYSLGPVTHLSMRSLSKGSFDGGGNLYVVSGNMTNDLATVVRFTLQSPTSPIDDSTVQAITEAKTASTDPTRNHYYAFGEIRTAFVPDGTFGYHTLPRHFDRTGYGRKVNLSATQFSIRASDRRLPLGLPSIAHNAGIPVQNTASGAWIIPGDWGIRVNE